jgi:5-methylthioadenosine/S-adenosylhomocysteine deaminase
MTGVSTATQLLTASWILPMSSPPIENGGIEVAGDRIVAVYTADELAARNGSNGKPSVQHAHFDNGIIVPGFINLHTHVEWSAQELIDTTSMLFDWIPPLVQTARSWGKDDFFASALAGVERIARSGTTCVLDSSFTGQAAVALSNYGLRAVVALELFGIDDAQVDRGWAEWLQKKEELLANHDIGNLIKISVAPHAPYSVCPPLMHKAFEWAAEAGVPVTVHVSETENEFDFIARGDNKLDSFLQKVHALPGGRLENIQYRGCGLTPVQHLAHEKLLVDSLVAAHCVKLTDNDINLLAEHRVKVAHCPRSNARLRNGIAPYRRLLEAGVDVGFGTDSLGSSDNLDILEEARFAYNLHRAVDPAFPFDSEKAIKALTCDAARILGMSDSIGSLQPGKLADIAIFNIVSAGNWAQKRPYDALLYGNVILQELLVSGRKVALNRLY